MAINKVLTIVTLWVIIFLPVNALAQDERVVPQKLLVGGDGRSTVCHEDCGWQVGRL